MSKSNACPNRPLQRPWLYVLLTLSTILFSHHAPAQQRTSSGAVETFEPVFDVAIEQRPRAGLYGITELMMAALEADIPTAKRLIAAGASIDEADDSQSTALMWAVHSGDVDIVKFFIAQGANVNAKAYRNATALMVAMTGKHEASAVILIDAGADPDGRGNSARNYLETAAESGMTDVVAALIRNGADLRSHGSSALSYAVSRGQEDAATLLLDAGVSANIYGAVSRKSILYDAAETGHLELVKLLISRGAEASQQGDSGAPLYPAVTGGHTAVALFLMDNGAVAKLEHVLAALRLERTETAIALIDRLDLEQVEKTELERLLAAADESGNEVFTQRLLESRSVRAIKEDAERSAARELSAATREHARLLFARQGDTQCLIGIWDSRSGNSAELTSIAKCPETVFVSKDSRSAFVVDDTTIRIIPLDASAADREIALPDLDYRTWLDQTTLRPDQNSNYRPGNEAMKPIGITRLDDGSLGLLASLGMPADDAYHYLLRRDADGWSVLNARWCGRWGCDDSTDFPAFRSTNVWAWPESGMIWHENLSLNPFFTARSTEMVDLEYESYQAAIQQREFEIDGVTSVLSFYTRPSEHSGTNHTLGIELTIDGGPPQGLAGNQCLTSIAGRFILVNEFFGGRFEVTDLGTGEAVISDLTAAMWLD